MKLKNFREQLFRVFW